jgi:ketosteroid isomerase-like protein
MLIGSVLFAAAGAFDATDVVNLRDNLKSVFGIGVGEAHAQSREDVDNMEDKNKEIVREGFARWANGTGSFFDLLTDDAEWTITGRSPISKTYTSRRQFLDEAITPINERLSMRIVPTLRGIYADGDTVIALWDGTATAKDGKPYKNTYSWYMTMKDGRIVKVVAFFDTIEFTEFWERVQVK